MLEAIPRAVLSALAEGTYGKLIAASAVIKSDFSLNLTHSTRTAS